MNEPADAMATILMLRAERDRLLNALIWCGGSYDFQDGGKAREGWLKLCAPLIRAAIEETPT